jgi:anaerobic selenocysteine-containing dehydrogenase
MTPEPDARDVRGACPLDCPDTCSWIVTVEGGKPVSLRGDPGHPFTRGSLCNKVEGYLAYARSPDRVRYPLRRVGPKGSGELTRISWDEALERIAAGSAT